MKHKTRNNRGYGLLEGSVGLMLVIGATLAALVLVFNVCSAFYHKLKLSIAASEGAIYAAKIVTPSLYTWNHCYRQPIVGSVAETHFAPRAKAYIEELMHRIGLPPAALIRVEYSDLYPSPGLITVRVTITENGLTMFGNGSLYPSSITLKESAAAVIKNDQPPALLCLRSTNSPGSSEELAIPAYGFYKPWITNAKRPAQLRDATVGVLRKSTRNTPIHFVTLPASVGSYFSQGTDTDRGQIDVIRTTYF